MKNFLIILSATALFVSCKRKDSLQTDKNIVVLTDTSKNSFSADTAISNVPMTTTTTVTTVAPTVAPIAVAPVRSNAPVRRRSSSGTSTRSSGSGSSTAGNTGSGTGDNGTYNTPAPAPQRSGMSKAAKGAIIGGVGGAAAGAIIGKNAKGAVIGGVAGAAGGYIIGRGKDRRDGRVQ